MNASMKNGNKVLVLTCVNADMKSDAHSDAVSSPEDFLAKMRTLGFEAGTAIYELERSKHAHMLVSDFGGDTFIGCPYFSRCNDPYYGIVGLMWGIGSVEALSFGPSSKWLVVEVDRQDVVQLGDYVKFKCGIVRFVGGPVTASRFIQARSTANGSVANGIACGADGEVVASGDFGVSVIRNNSVAMAADYGSCIGGSHSMCAADYKSNAVAGDQSQVVVGDCSNAISGIGGVTITGDRSFGKSGDFGLTSVGAFSVGMTGVNGIVQGGVGSQLIAMYVSRAGLRNIPKICTATVGENGILPNRAYRAANGKLVPEESMLQEDKDLLLARTLNQEIFGYTKSIGGAA